MDDVERVARAIGAIHLKPEYIDEHWREYEEEARAAIAAMPGWRPIETAPKDHLILLSPGDVVASGFLHAVKVGGWVDGDDDEPGAWEIFGASWTPTHWMPLPAPPKESE